MAATIKYLGMQIKLSSSYKGTATPWGDNFVKQHHKVYVKLGNEGVYKQIQFDFYCNDVKLDKEKLCMALYYFLSDGIAYDNSRNIDDFQSEFGYTKVSECLKAYEGCKKAWEKWADFGIDPYLLANRLQKDYNF
jgi:hypothetical protein